MAVPKRKKSKAKTAMRRAQWLRMPLPELSICPECNQPKAPHRVCPHCGYYKNKEVVEVI
ncbi:MAG: 50S ribosomal protein L32 [Hydrogenothermaceae bacterium]|nr:50S ribosomal protein L32 [Hydrogenothermaceae bacterium]